MYGKMLSEDRGDLLGFGNFFMSDDAHFMRKRRTVSINKLPSASELALMN